ncbi:ComEC/Rec2 family competence protein [Marisediminicola senii]|uniref:ComEC/Rec2 family competence protein n=1 Tax=Marisediminicola senii TaxID=2711233 RepID=UPI0013ECCC3A|nr:ComEC/Rec2 family competence protein [Marisediminicola senii]
MSAPGVTRRVDLRLAIPAACAWVAAAVMIAWRDAAAPAAVVAWAGTVTATAVVAVPAVRRAEQRGAGPRRAGRQRAGRHRPARAWVAVVALSLAAASVVLTAVAVAAPDRRPARMAEAAASGRYIEVEATTTQTVLAGTGSFAVTVTRVTVGDETLSVSVPARVFGAATDDDIGIGAVIAVNGTVAATEAADDIAFLLFPTGPPRLLQGPPPALDWANALRSTFRAQAATLPGDGGALLPGLAIGDTSAVSEELDTAMKDSALSHLTAVSGANCAIVIGLVMLAGGAAGIPRGWRIALSVLVLGGFVLIVTPEPSVLRASVMAVLVLATLGSGRPTRGIPVLSLAVIGLLAFDPWLARSYGFVLSVLATAGLLVLAGPLTRGIARWMPTPVAAMIAIPLAAQLACQPVLVLLAPTIPVYGVLANVLAAPAAPVATVLGLVACVTLPWLPALPGVVAFVAWLPASWIAGVATFFGPLPGARLAWPEGWPGALLAAAATVLGLLATVGAGLVGPRVRIVVVATLAVGVVVALGIAAGSAWRIAATRPADWQYAQCDVGQGDAVLVRSAGRTALVDTGPDPPLLQSCLDTLGIGRIDLLVLTHFDLDHVGGSSAVVGMVDRVLVGPADDAAAEAVKRDLADGGAEVTQVSRGATGALGELRWSVLWPTDPLRGVEPGNAASITLQFEGAGGCAGGCLSALLLGDLGQPSQSALLATTPVGGSDIVKVAHHGSADQEPRLYRRVAATIGLIGVGADNDYGHPTATALDMLAAAGTAALRSDENGIVLVAPGPGGSAGGDALTVWTERTGEGGSREDAADSGRR